MHFLKFFSKTTHFLILFSALTMCGNKGFSQAGVALSFDDDFIDEWYDAMPMFEKYGAKVTIYLTRYDRLTPERKAKLAAMRDAGHEIGYHSVSHVNLYEFLKTHTLQEYMDQQIEPNLKLMNADGFFPITFAYPYGARTPETDVEMLKRFCFLRTSGRLYHDSKNYTVKLGGTQQLTEGACLDEPYFNAEQLDTALEKVRQAGEGVVVLYTHKIKDVIDDSTHIRPQTLEAVLKTVQEKGLHFYTMHELQGTCANVKE